MLNILFTRDEHVFTLIHNICAIHAHALGAIHITPFRVTLATASLGCIPVLVSFSESIGILWEEIATEELLWGRLEGEVLDVLATTVARAVIGAGSAGTTLAFVTREALAFTGIAITNTAVGAFGISVVIAEFVGGINPSKFEGTHTLRAVTGCVS